MDWQAVANFGFAALVAFYLLVRLEATIKELSRQIHLNTTVLARISGQDINEVKELLANGGES